jgi:hypothetical protein
MINWDAVGAVGETLGSVAVLITLIYLSFQIRHARSELRHSVAQHRFDTFRSLSLEIVHDPELARIENALEEAIDLDHKSFEALEDAANLSAVEKKRYRHFQSAWFMYRVQTVEQIDQLSEDQRRAFDLSTRRLYSNGVSGLWFQWFLDKTPHTGGIAQRYIASLISECDDT